MRANVGQPFAPPQLKNVWIKNIKRVNRSHCLCFAEGRAEGSWPESPGRRPVRGGWWRRQRSEPVWRWPPSECADAACPWSAPSSSQRRSSPRSDKDKRTQYENIDDGGVNAWTSTKHHYNVNEIWFTTYGIEHYQTCLWTTRSWPENLYVQSW